MRPQVMVARFWVASTNLRLRRDGDTRTRRIPRTAPGEMSELRAFLRAGSFRLWCSLPGHETAGMSARLRVVKRS